MRSQILYNLALLHQDNVIVLPCKRIKRLLEIFQFQILYLVKVIAWGWHGLTSDPRRSRDLAVLILKRGRGRGEPNILVCQSLIVGLNQRGRDFAIDLASKRNLLVVFLFILFFCWGMCTPSARAPSWPFHPSGFDVRYRNWCSL